MRIGFKRYDTSTAKKFTRLPLGLRVGALSGLGLLGRRVLKAAPAYGRFYALGPPKTMAIQAPDHANTGNHSFRAEALRGLWARRPLL